MGGQGANARSVAYGEERAPTLRSQAGGNSVPMVMTAFGIGSDQSHAMLSDNPRAGIYEAATSRTLDCSGGNPVCHQGGIAVVQPAYSVRPLINTQVQEEKTPSLMARDYKDALLVGKPPVYSMDRAAFSQGPNAQYGISIEEERTQTLTSQGPNAVAEPRDAEYTIRRLTTGECCLLQGYPPGWTEDLGTEAPTDEEIRWWAGVFEVWRKARGKSARPRSRNQIVKWLRDPRTDAAEYKAYGNSVAIPCVFFVLAGIAWAEETEAVNLEGN